MSVDTRAVCVQKEGLWTRGPRITSSFVPARFAAASRCELTVVQALLPVKTPRKDFRSEFDHLSLVFQWSRITEE